MTAPKSVATETTAASELGFLAGGGEMGALIRAHPWAATSVGPLVVDVVGEVRQPGVQRVPAGARMLLPPGAHARSSPPAMFLPAPPKQV
mgnify:CR=1 FL=1